MTPTASARSTRWTACCGSAERPDEPAWDSDLGRGPARLARRVLVDRPAPPRRDVRRAGGRQRPGVPAPRDDRVGGAGGPEGRDFARSYVHTGMVGYDGAKMSKSKGNLVLVSDELRERDRPDGDPARAARPPLPQRLGVDRRRRSGGKAMLSAWGAAVEKPRGAPTGPVVERVRAALADDLDAPAACDAVQALGGRTPTSQRTGAGDVIRAWWTPDWAWTPF